MENKVEKNDILKTVFEWIELVAFSVVCVIIILNCFARYSPVDGASMNQTLQDKDVLILSNLFYEPEVGDIVVFASDNTNGKIGTGYNKPYVKRVIATEGQHLIIDQESRTITVDGEVSECEEYAYYDPTKMMFVDAYWPNVDMVIPEGHVYVMGDNRYNSSDSRVLGPVDTRDIIGKVVFRLMPEFGTVE